MIFNASDVIFSRYIFFNFCFAEARSVEKWQYFFIKNLNPLRIGLFGWQRPGRRLIFADNPWPVLTRPLQQFGFWNFRNLVQLDKYETAPNFIQLSPMPKLEIGLFVDFCVFPCFYQFLHDLIIKLFCRSKQNNFMIRSYKNW